jgi:hypothetical protein
VPTIQDTINELEVYFKLIQGAEASKAGVSRQAFRDEGQYDRVIRRIDETVKEHRKEIERILELYDREPERHYLRHGHKLAQLYEGGSYEESIFIMIKFPEKDSQNNAAQELQAVIDAVRDAVELRKYKARMASEQNLQDWIWDNVELFLYGCGRDIAIIENKYLPEWNPNVAMEWGVDESDGQTCAVPDGKVNSSGASRLEWA